MVLLSVLFQGIFYSLHDSEDLFLLKSLANDLHGDGQTFHLDSVIVSVCTLRNAIELFEAKRSREGIKNAVNMCDGHDAAGVVKLYHATVSERTNAQECSQLTRLNKKVYPQLLTASFIPS